EESRRLTRVRVVSPEAMHEPLLAEYHVRLALLLREFGEGAERALGARLYEGRVADERHAREAARRVAARVEGSAVERSLQPVVADQSRHDYCVDGALGENVQDLAFVVAFGQGVNQQGPLVRARLCAGRRVVRLRARGHRGCP